MSWLSDRSHIHFHPENSSFCPPVKVTSLFLSTWFLSLNLTNGAFTLCIWMRHERCFAHHTQMLKERLCTTNRGWRVTFACRWEARGAWQTGGIWQPGMRTCLKFWSYQMPCVPQATNTSCATFTGDQCVSRWPVSDTDTLETLERFNHNVMFEQQDSVCPLCTKISV